MLALDLLMNRCTKGVLLSKVTIARGEWKCLHILRWMLSFLETLAKTLSIFFSPGKNRFLTEIFLTMPHLVQLLLRWIQTLCTQDRLLEVYSGISNFF